MLKSLLAIEGFNVLAPEELKSIHGGNSTDLKFEDGSDGCKNNSGCTEGCSEKLSGRDHCSYCCVA